MAKSNAANFPKSLSARTVAGLGLIGAGIFFAAFRAGLVSVALTALGTFTLLLGIWTLLVKNYALSALEIVGGIVIIALAWTVPNVAMLLLGLALTTYLVYTLICNISMLKHANTPHKVLFLSVWSFLLLIGVLLFAANFAMSDAMFIAIGSMAIIGGLALIVAEFAAGKMKARIDEA